MGEKKSNKLIAQVKQYVEEHYAEEISFEAIAKGLFVHPKYLSQLFKRVTGENFVSYLNGYRIQRALELLQSGHYMVYEVSEMTGFRNATYLSPSEVG
jgi:YesN/AraC family two-component response regulator